MSQMLDPEASYVVLPRRSLGRYILSYEVMPLSLCYSLKGNHLISADDAHSLWQSGSLKETDCMLEFRSSLDSKESFLSLSELSNVWFPSEAELSRFLERSYENFDVKRLSCKVLPDLEQVDSEILLSVPETVDQQLFADDMAEVDGILSLLHDKLAVTETGIDLLSSLKIALEDEQGLLCFSLNLDRTELENGQFELAQAFLKLCSRNGITRGWIPTDIIEQLKASITTDLKQGDAFTRWEDKVKKLLEYDVDAFPFTDDGGYIVYKAIAMTLMNPEIKGLKSMKSTLGEQIGTKVYKMSRLFVLARAGYSMLADTQREMVGTDRITLQKISAWLHNRESGLLLPCPLTESSPSAQLTYQADDQDDISSEPDESGRAQVAEKVVPYIDNVTPDMLEADFILSADGSSCTWLAELTKFNGATVYRIEGVNPLAGFDLHLLYVKDESLKLRVIDVEGQKKPARCSGKFSTQVLSLQSQLPSGSRFELNDRGGLFLCLPLNWVEEKGIRQRLLDVFKVLEPLKLLKKSSKFC